MHKNNIYWINLQEKRGLKIYVCVCVSVFTKQVQKPELMQEPKQVLYQKPKATPKSKEVLEQVLKSEEAEAATEAGARAGAEALSQAGESASPHPSSRVGGILPRGRGGGIGLRAGENRLIFL